MRTPALVLSVLLVLPVFGARAASLDPQIRAAHFDVTLGRSRQALLDLQVARAQGLLDEQARQADLLIAELMVAQGLDQRAAQFLDGLTPGAAKAVPGDTWLHLARLRQRRGDAQGALAALDAIGAPLTDPVQERERLLLQGTLLLAQGRLEEAESALRRLQAAGRRKDDRVAFGSFNLAVVLHQAGRGDEARDLLEDLGRLRDSRERALRTLADKANLTLAYDRLAAGDMEAATEYFEQARLDGPVSGTALMGLGRAWEAQGEYKKALVPWLKLSKRDPADPLVLDALLAVPYGLGKLEAFKQSLQYYQRALRILEQELERVEKVRAQVDSGAMVDGLVAAFDADRVLDSEHLDELPERAGSPHLWRLFASHEFQELLRNYVRTGRSLERLDAWTSQLDEGDPLPPARRQDLERRAVALRGRLEALASRLRARLRQLADQELEGRRKRIQAYADETRFSIAQIYDYAAKRWGGR